MVVFSTCGLCLIKKHQKVHAEKSNNLRVRNLIFISSGASNSRGNLDDIGINQAKAVANYLLDKNVTNAIDQANISSSRAAQQTWKIINRHFLDENPEQNMEVVVREGLRDGVVDQNTIPQSCSKNKDICKDISRIQSEVELILKGGKDFELFICSSKIISYIVMRTLKASPERCNYLDNSGCGITWITITKDNVPQLKMFNSDAFLHACSQSNIAS